MELIALSVSELPTGLKRYDNRKEVINQNCQYSAAACRSEATINQTADFNLHSESGPELSKRGGPLTI